MTETSLSLQVIHQIRDECLCLASQRAARVLARRFDRLFAPLGITNGQFSMMVPLLGAWRPRLGELAEFLAMDSATMTAAAKTLEKRGLMVLTPDDQDARIRRPALTDAGRGVMVQAVPLWKSEHALIQTEVTAMDARKLATILSQLG